MVLDNLLSLELIVVLTLFCFRNFSNFLIFYKEEKIKILSSALTDNFKFIGIMFKSVFKLWWTGDQFKFEKKIANGLSSLFYFSIIVLTITFLIGYII
ncbi:hypothetical protein OB69_07675 [Roseivirga seohaensis subsp. aquiponti]|uniref:Uncharacterized protein n=1 Tax=Roseivirga seohaensis subsp. aquiponti TaxID=1566026 RepID=A0A0L8ALV0_9BACT|nr:hypothetical protein OB69_07675 [Roseivirga seohaensis subsp. aquiponti]|tara:strand:+ start:4826 stop:5119 length:294 start_codon:yes stop_codon:yes gene_type:complete